MRFIFDIPNDVCEESGIYEIVNNLNNAVYVGRTKNFKKRYKQHLASFKRGDCNYKFLNFLNNYPDCSLRFKLIEVTDDIKAEEEKYIKERGSVENGFNIFHNDEEFKEKDFKYVKTNKAKARKKKRKERATKAIEGVISDFLKELVAQPKKEKPINIHSFIMGLGRKKKKKIR